MLCALRIRDLALIDELEIEFAPGLNVLTGETGAGKSIVVGALDLVLGGRSSVERIRRGAEQSVVEALYAVEGRADVAALCAEAGLPADPAELLVRRVLTTAGRSRAYVNGALANLATLTALTHPLVDLSGQHEQVSLLQTATHLRLLDGFAGLGDEVQRFGSDHDALEAARRECEALRTRERERAAREEFLRFQIDEIERAGLRGGEDAELERERAVLVHAERLRAHVQDALGYLGEGREAASGQVIRAQKEIARAGVHDASLAPLAARLDGLAIELDDLAAELHAYLGRVDVDPRRLEEIENRRAQIRALARKYGATVEQIVAQRDQLQAELASLQTADERVEALSAAIAERGQALLVRARELSLARNRAARRLETAVQDVLQSLAMAGCRFRVVVEQPDGLADRPARHGLDRVEFRVATNVGEDEHPLARVASGGELSRILLAVKHALRAADRISTYVFDEVDAGIGGQVASVVGRRLAETSRRHQILCITHLPQIACYGDAHFVVAKGENAGRTVTTVRRLNDAERVEELARMLGGAVVTDRTRAAAAELLRAGREAATATP